MDESWSFNSFLNKSVASRRAEFLRDMTELIRKGEKEEALETIAKLKAHLLSDPGIIQKEQLDDELAFLDEMKRDIA